jgi:hypothetical protein
MDELALVKDMRKATGRILSARLPIRLRTGLDGIVIEAESCLATGQRRLQAIVTWEALAEAPRPLIRPLVDELIAFLERGGAPPASFDKPTLFRPLIDRRRLH